MGVFKIDWALDGPIPFTAPECQQAGTIHLGGTLEEITAAEQATSSGKHPENPFVLLAQQSRFDASRAPAGKHTAWAYCHVPNGSTVDCTDMIEKQVERFAPGFRDRILARHTMNTRQMEAYNANYIGGDINGGIIDIGQLFTRPGYQSVALQNVGPGFVHLLLLYPTGWRGTRHVWVPRSPNRAPRPIRAAGFYPFVNGLTSAKQGRLLKSGP